MSHSETKILRDEIARFVANAVLRIVNYNSYNKSKPTDPNIRHTCPS